MGTLCTAPQFSKISRNLELLILTEQHLYPHVDFYSASTYHLMGIPLDLYTPIFAMSRVTGWVAHALEQYSNNRIIRPAADYTGPVDQMWVPVEKR